MQNHHRRRQIVSKNDVDEILEKPNHYTIVLEDFNAQAGQRKAKQETSTGKFELK